MTTTLIPRSSLPAIADAIRSAVNQHGHPDDVPIDALVKLGIDHETADKCMSLLTSEDFPSEPAAAVAKWMRLIGEFSE